MVEHGAMPSFRKLAGGRFEAVVRVPPHPTKTKRFDTKRDAREWAQALESELRAGRSIVATPVSGRTLRLAVEKYELDELGHLAHGTRGPIKRSLAYLVKHLGDRRITS